MTIAPRLVSSVMFRVPERGSPVAGGVPTFLMLGLADCAGDALGLGFGFQVQLVGAADVLALALAFALGVPFLPPVASTTPQITRASATAPATPEPMIAARLRRRFALVARSAISRSRRARAAARWRSLVGLTVVQPSRSRASG